MSSQPLTASTQASSTETDMKNTLSDRATTFSWHDACRCQRHRICLAGLTALVCSGFTWPGTLPHLAYEAAHGSVEERLEAVQLLGRYSGDEARDALLAALEDREDVVQLQAAESLGHTGVEAGAARMLEWSNARDPERRAIALRALASMRSPRAIEVGTRARTDSEASVRLAGVELLAHSGDAGASALLRALEDHEASVRLAAIEALGPQPPPAALPKLSVLARGDDASVREASLRALGRMRELSAVPVLLQGLRDPLENVRLAALAALGDSGAPAAVAPLRAALSGELRAARTAVAALGRLDEPRAREALAAQLAQPNTELSEDVSAALVERARRLAQPAEWSATFAAISGGLRDAGLLTAPRVASLANALAELAPFTDIEPAKPALLAALHAEHAPALPLSKALLALAAPELLPALLERLPLTAAEERGPWLDALELAWSAGQRAEGVLGVLQGLSAQGRAENRLRAAELGARVAADLQPAAAGPERVRALVEQLMNAPAAGVPSALRALTRALTASPEALEPSLRTQLLDRAAVLLRDADENTSSYALDLLRSLHEPQSAAVIAQQLRLGSVARRAQAVCALADFPSADTRRLLRYTLQNDGPRVAECAVLALAEVGDERDSGALLHAAERGTWPLPAAAAYALARIAQRGVAKKHTFARSLCHLRARPDVYVQANLAAGLAALGGEPCEGTDELRQRLASPGPSALRVASARLLRVLADPESERALAACSADADPEVARACRPGVTPAADGGRLDVNVLASDGATRLRDQPVALRFDSGLVYVGRSDPNGRVLLPGALGARVVLEDPADVP